MTVSVTQEQMRQNVFHHTLTVPLSSGQKNRPPVFQKSRPSVFLEPSPYLFLGVHANRPPVFPCLLKGKKKIQDSIRHCIAK
jgi:hypothetical protein